MTVVLLMLMLITCQIANNIDFCVNFLALTSANSLIEKQIADLLIKFLSSLFHLLLIFLILDQHFHHIFEVLFISWDLNLLDV